MFAFKFAKGKNQDQEGKSEQGDWQKRREEQISEEKISTEKNRAEKHRAEQIQSQVKAELEAFKHCGDDIRRGLLQARRICELQPSSDKNDYHEH